MITIQNDFFSTDLFSKLQEYCTINPFTIQKAGEKEFSVLETPKQLEPLLQLAGHSLIFSFIRKEYQGFDDELRIHADNIIQGEKSAFASVLFINNPEGVTTNGTAFYDHKTHGSELPKGISDEDFNYLLENESNNESIWTENARVYSKPNRMISYKSNLFHSKFPKEIIEGERIVLVCFYKSNTDS